MKCMGDFGTPIRDRRVERDRLDNREPAMIRPQTLVSENNLYYSEPLAQEVVIERKVINRPVEARKPVSKRPKVNKISISRPMIPKKEKKPGFFSRLFKKKDKPSKVIKKPIKIKPPQSFRNNRPVIKPAVRPVIKPLVKPVVRKYIKAPNPKASLMAKKNVSKPKKVVKAKGMSGNYCMGDFGEGMGFKLPKIKMPRITISKKQQAAFLKPIAKITGTAAPMLAFIPGVGTIAAAAAGTVATASGAVASQAEMDIAKKKAKEQAKKLEKQMAADMKAQEAQEAAARAGQIKNKNKNTAIIAASGVGLVAAGIGAYFFLKDR